MAAFMLVTVVLYELIISKEYGPTDLASWMVFLLMPLQGKSRGEQLNFTGKDLFMGQANVTKMILVQSGDVSTHVSL
jgi:hypothetical protein